MPLEQPDASDPLDLEAISSLEAIVDAENA